MYRGLRGSVFSQGSVSKMFELKHGIRQGSALSAKLYLIIINDLINELEKKTMYDIKTSLSVQADDIDLITSTCTATQQLVVRITVLLGDFPSHHQLQTVTIWKASQYYINVFI